MQKKYLAVEIGRQFVRAGMFVHGRPMPSEIFTQEVNEAAGGLRQALSLLLKPLAGRRGIRQFHKTIVGLPADDLSIRIVEMPFEDRKKIVEALPFELAGLLHVEVEDVVVDAVGLAGNKVLAVAAEKRLIKDYLEVLGGFGIDPCWLGPSVFAIPVLLEELYGAKGVRAFIGPDTFCVTEDGKPRLFKPVKRLDSIRLGAGFLEAEGVSIDEAVYAGWDGEELKEIFSDARLVPMELPGGMAPEGAGVCALALLFSRGLWNSAAGFRKGEFEYTRDKVSLRRGLEVTAALCACLVLLGLGDIYIRYSGMSSELNSYRKALRASYAELFPNERNAADPVYQIETKIKAMDKETKALGGGIKPLDVFKAVSENTPEALGIRFDEFSIANGRLSAKGEAASFQAANALKDAMLKAGPFSEVSMGETKAKPGNRAYFSLNAVLR